MSAEQQNSEIVIATAILAAGAVRAHPEMTMVDAVRMARSALQGTGTPRVLSPTEIAASVRPDKIKCFEDGTWHTMLRRYLMRKYSMTPEQYRMKWGLPDDYPLVAPNAAAARSKIAKKSGLGKK